MCLPQIDPGLATKRSVRVEREFRVGDDDRELQAVLHVERVTKELRVAEAFHRPSILGVESANPIPMRGRLLL